MIRSNDFSDVQGIPLYAKFRDFAEAVLGFLRNTVPKRFDEFSSTITDNFRVIDPKEFRILA